MLLFIFILVVLAILALVTADFIHIWQTNARTFEEVEREKEIDRLFK